MTARHMQLHKQTKLNPLWVRDAGATVCEMGAVLQGWPVLNLGPRAPVDLHTGLVHVFYCILHQIIKMGKKVIIPPLHTT